MGLGSAVDLGDTVYGFFVVLRADVYIMISAYSRVGVQAEGKRKEEQRQAATTTNIRKNHFRFHWCLIHQLEYQHRHCGIVAHNTVLVVVLIDEEKQLERQPRRFSQTRNTVWRAR